MKMGPTESKWPAVVRGLRHTQEDDCDGSLHGPVGYDRLRATDLIADDPRWPNRDGEDATPDVRSHDGTAPLHLAACFGRAQLVGLLVEHGAAVNARTDSGLTPLHLAAALGHLSTVEKPLALGANLFARTVQGNTALALALHEGHEEVVALLWQRGALS
ncbi:MAG: ankyrin repeat domain-containing protein [Candidatus Zipacnadales bacterium]